VICGCADITSDGLELPDYYEVDVIRSKGQLEDGRAVFGVWSNKTNFKQGPYRQFSFDNKLVQTGFYEEDKKDGIWRTYSADSVVTRVAFYLRGTLVTEVDLLNDTINKLNIDGERTGFWIDKTMTRIEMGVYHKDVKVGLWNERIKRLTGYKIWDAVSSGMYSSGKRSGEWSLVYETNIRDPFIAYKISRTRYQKFYENGLLMSYVPDPNNRLVDGNGYLITSFPNGMVREKHEHCNGTPCGIGLTYDIYGLNDTDLTHYVHIDRSFKDGLLHGKVKVIFVDGVLRVDGQYENGVKQGTWRMNHRWDHGPIQILRYEDGIVQDTTYEERDQG